MNNFDMYKQIGSYYLYDNQFETDYLILCNRKKRMLFEVVEGKIITKESEEYSYDLPWSLSQALKEIYQLEDVERQKSIEIIEKACKKDNLILIQLKEPLLYIKINTTHISHYNAYHIYYNETKNKVKLDDYEIAYHWKIGKSEVGAYRLYEYCN